MSYHFPCARPYALLTRPSLLLTQSKLPKCLREMLTQSYATQGFAYAEFDCKDRFLERLRYMSLFMLLSLLFRGGQARHLSVGQAFPPTMLAHIEDGKGLHEEGEYKRTSDIAK